MLTTFIEWLGIAVAAILGVLVTSAFVWALIGPGINRLRRVTYDNSEFWAERYPPPKAPTRPVRGRWRPAMLVLLATPLSAAWLTHVVTCINAGSWGLLLVGAICAPVGVIHGVMIWMR